MDLRKSLDAKQDQVRQLESARLHDRSVVLATGSCTLLGLDTVVLLDGRRGRIEEALAPDTHLILVPFHVYRWWVRDGHCAVLVPILRVRRTSGKWLSMNSSRG
jgi:hypothetical protein